MREIEDSLCKVLSPSRRRDAVRHVQGSLGISERRACQTLGQPRSTHRYRSTKPEADRPLAKRLHKLAEQNPRAGYRRMTVLLKGEGWCINQKRVHRLWKQAGLQVPKKQRKRRRLGTSANGCVRLKASYPNHVWSVDFLFDSTEDGRQLKFMPILDEYTRQCFLLDVSPFYYIGARHREAGGTVCGAWCASEPTLGQRP